MKVVLLNKFATPTGGADVHCINLARLLSHAGHEVRMFSTSDSEPREDETGSYIRCQVRHGDRDSLRGVSRASVAGRAIWNREAEQAMWKLITVFRPDIVHSHKLYPQLSVAPVVAARRAGVPVVQTAHDYEFVSASPTSTSFSRLDRQESRVSYRALNAVLFAVKRTVHVPRVTQWVAVSEYVARVYAERGITASVLPNFVNTPECTLGFGERQGAVFVGRLVAEKGILDALEVARALPDLQVSIIGDGPLTGVVHEAAKTLGNVTLLGWQSSEDVNRALGRARAVLMPSRWADPGPLVSLESLAAGTPVLTYAVGGLGEYVRASGGGVVTSDLPELIEATRQTTTDGEFFARLSVAGRTAASTVHGPGRYVESIVDLYERARTLGARASATR